MSVLGDYLFRLIKGEMLPRAAAVVVVALLQRLTTTAETNYTK